MKVLLLRHGPVCVPSDLCYGHLEVPLQLPGAKWVGAARQFVQQALGGDFTVWSSPSKRAIDIAQLFCESPSKVQQDARLRELNFGAFEGRRWSEIPPAESIPWTDSNGEQPCPEGESYNMLHDRVCEMLPLWYQKASPVLAVCHGGPIRTLLQAALAIPYSHLFQLQIDYASFSLISLENSTIKVLGMNHCLDCYTEDLV